VTSSLSPIVRPNGKLYRPRKLRVVFYELPSEDEVYSQTIVLGTHDVELARSVARYGGILHYLTQPHIGWMRLGYDRGEQLWLHDDVRGAACVIFNESDDPEELT